jgi:hypothetical protein
MYCVSLIDVPEIGVRAGDPIFVQPELPNNMVKIEHYNTNILISRNDVRAIQQHQWEMLRQERLL